MGADIVSNVVSKRVQRLYSGRARSCLTVEAGFTNLFRSCPRRHTRSEGYEGWDGGRGEAVDLDCAALLASGTALVLLRFPSELWLPAAGAPAVQCSLVWSGLVLPDDRIQGNLSV